MSKTIPDWIYFDRHLKTTMLKALLLDLDNTLLHNDDRAFARAFLQSINAHFRATCGYDDMASALRQSIRALSGARDGITTNAALIRQILTDRTPLSPSQIDTALASFFQDSYPALQPCVKPVPGAVELLKNLLASDEYAIVIATNPLYPVNAIKQRMAWAGLPADSDRYALITGTETMHYSKPDPAYYAEILAQVGIEPDEALMIGDSNRNDIQPAQTVGIHTWALQPDDPDADFHGSLADFAQHINDPAWRKARHARALSPDMILPQYRGNIGALFSLLSDVQTNFWHKRPDPEEWSIVQVLCHLVESEHTEQRPRLQQILAQDNPFITAPHPPGPDIPVCSEDGYQVAYEFVRVRQQTINFLDNLQKTDWQRPARHSIFGITSLLEMAHFTAQHDRLHLNQLCQTIGRCYAD